jgi:RNA polymerase sigma-70 factor, ECF subfamily
MRHGPSQPPRPEGRLSLVREPRRDRLAGEDAGALLAALVCGDQRAAILTYRHFEPLARRILRRILGPGPGADVDDLVQEVFLRLFERAHTVANPRALTAFVMAVATRAAQTELRRRFVRRLVRFSSDGRLPELATAGADPAAREAVVRFYALLDRLAVKDRSAYVLRFMEGLELGEVASALGVSLATVKRRLDRAASRVKRLVDADPGLQEYLAGLQGGSS